MADFKRPNPYIPFVCSGIRLGSGGALPDGKFSFLKNVRVYETGRIDARPGLGLPIFNAPLTDLVVHSIRRLNDPSPGAATPFVRVIGAGGSLYVDQTRKLNGVLSGNPLTMVPYRPDQSVRSWMYLGDSLGMFKASAAGEVFSMGIAPPLGPVSATIAPPQYQVINDFEALTSLVPSGVAGGLTVENRFNTSIRVILYDSGNTGWASLVPTIYTADIQGGALATINGAETVLLNEFIPAMQNANITGISYDAGATGLCTIHAAGLTVQNPVNAGPGGGDVGTNNDPFNDGQLTPIGRGRAPTPPPNRPPRPTSPRTRGNSIPGVLPNTIVFLNPGGGNQEYVRVLSVAIAPDGSASFRVSTVNNHVAGELMTGANTVRTYTTVNHLAGETFVTNMVSSTMGAVGTGGFDYITPLNLGLINGRPVSDSDNIHISMKLFTPKNLIQGRVIFDVDSAVNDYAHNAYFFTFRSNDITPIYTGQSTVVAQQPTIVQNNALNGAVEVGSIGLRPGDAQWTELIFKVSDLHRIGSDAGQTLANVNRARIEFTVSGSCIVKVDALWIGGTFGPDIGDIGLPYLYRERYRSSETGAKSNLSPPMRFGVSPRRQAVLVTGTQSADPQVDKVDWFRWGGSLGDWIYVGSSDNTNPPQFTDVYQDDAISSNDIATLDDFQPFPTIDIPHRGFCNVAGTSVTWQSGDKFDTRWSPGSEIIINGLVHNLYAQPSSQTRLEIVDNGGTLANVPFELSQPTLLAIPLPRIFGPTEDGGFIFGVGDLYQPGVLFWTNGNNPDSASDKNELELSTPTEPLMNGVLFDNRPMVASTERWWGVYPDFANSNVFRTAELPVGRGLYAPYGICAGEVVFFIADDGIRATAGGQAESITDDLYELFPHDGQPGKTITIGNDTIIPPDFTQRKNLRLSLYDGILYFDFVDTLGGHATLVYHTGARGWISYDAYTPPVITHYGEEGEGVHNMLAGGNDGNLYSLGSRDDDNTANVAGVILTAPIPSGDNRAKYTVGDYDLDADIAGNAAGVTGSLLPDNLSTVAIQSQAFGLAKNGRAHYVLDVNNGDGAIARNVGLELRWAAKARVKFWGWQPSIIQLPEDTFLRATDWDDAGVFGEKFIQGCLIEADTLGITRTVQVVSGSGVVQATLAVTHNGQTQIPYSFAPFVAHTVKLRPTDAALWRLFRVRWVFEPMPELATNWTTQGTTHDLPGFQHVREIELAHISTADVTLTINVDGTVIVLLVPNSAGLYRKTHVTLPANKGKIYTYSLTSALPFRLFKRDCSVLVKPWNDSGPYRSTNPFGGAHRADGAAI